jgi:hypothetical protein
MAAVICYAQEHLHFMDIPFDCPIDTYCSKLITNKGLVEAKMSDDDEQYSNMHFQLTTKDFIK